MRVLVTRSAEDAPSLSARLRAEGFDVVEVPVLARETVPNDLAGVGRFDWLVLTSVAAAESATALAGGKAAVVGPATAERAIELGFSVGAVSPSGTGADLASAMGDLHGRRVVFPHAEVVAADTARGLRDAGAEVVDVVTYRTVAVPGAGVALRAAWPVDLVTLLSGSAARHLAGALAGTGLSAPCIVIGPTTAAAARQAGLEVAAVADPHTVEGVVAAVRGRRDRSPPAPTARS
jgi:uroporphyrinogen III methyltransferase/synthase